MFSMPVKFWNPALAEFQRKTYYNIDIEESEYLFLEIRLSGTQGMQNITYRDFAMVP